METKENVLPGQRRSIKIGAFLLPLSPGWWGPFFLLTTPLIFDGSDIETDAEFLTPYFYRTPSVTGGQSL